MLLNFRLSGLMVNSDSILKTKQIDVLYMDNTYLDPTKTFPTREQAIQMCFSLINEHRDRRIVIGIAAFSFFGHLCTYVHDVQYVQMLDISCPHNLAIENFSTTLSHYTVCNDKIGLTGRLSDYITVILTFCIMIHDS